MILNESYTDEQLADRYYREQNAVTCNGLFMLFYERYHIKAYNWVFRIIGDIRESEELTTDLLLSLREDLKKYRIRDNFGGWFRTKVRNACLEYLRIRKKQPLMQVFTETSGKTSDPYLTEENDSNHTSGNVLTTWNGMEQTDAPDSFKRIVEEKEESLTVMELALQLIEKKQKQCLISFYFEKKSQGQIEKERRYKAGAAKSYLENGKRQLSQRIQRAQRIYKKWRTFESGPQHYTKMLKVLALKEEEPHEHKIIIWLLCLLSPGARTCFIKRYLEKETAVPFIDIVYETPYKAREVRAFLEEAIQKLKTMIKGRRKLGAISRAASGS